MGDKNTEILSILGHYFILGLKASEAACKAREIQGQVMIGVQKAQNWYKCFEKGYLCLEIKPRSGRALVMNFHLKWKVENKTISIPKTLHFMVIFIFVLKEQ